MVAVLRKREPAPDPLSAFTEEQREQLRAWQAAREARQRGTVEPILDAVYRACIGIGRAIKPERRWDGL